MKYVQIILRLVIAFVFIQSLYFKFTGHPEAVHIFSTIGMEPWGRYLVGISELIVAILLFIPRTGLLASAGAMGLMIGAIGFHLFTPLGIVVQWDGQSDHGQLFAMAVTALIFSTIVFLINAPKDKQEFMDQMMLKK